MHILSRLHAFRLRFIKEYLCLFNYVSDVIIYVYSVFIELFIIY